MAVIDWFSRYVLSWRLAVSLESDFCVEALGEALRRRRGRRPRIFNTDQGSQFTSETFTGRLKAQGVDISMDGRGRCLVRRCLDGRRPAWLLKCAQHFCRAVTTACESQSVRRNAISCCQVTAETLYEAVAQALGIRRSDTWVEEIGEGLGTRAGKCTICIFAMQNLPL